MCVTFKGRCGSKGHKHFFLLLKIVINLFTHFGIFETVNRCFGDPENHKQTTICIYVIVNCTLLVMFK